VAIIPYSIQILHGQNYADIYVKALPHGIKHVARRFVYAPTSTVRGISMPLVIRAVTMPGRVSPALSNLCSVHFTLE
jgi:hypothetical protein